jgi:subtilisin family serine protease
MRKGVTVISIFFILLIIICIFFYQVSGYTSTQEDYLGNFEVLNYIESFEINGNELNVYDTEGNFHEINIVNSTESEIQAFQNEILGNFEVNEEEYFDGYIIELSEKPLLSLYNELKVRGYSFNEINANLNEQRSRIHQEQFVVKQRILEDFNLIAKDEIVNVLNGFVVNVSESEAKEIENYPEVKSIHKNYMVEANIDESVSHINATEVWYMDEDGNNCFQTGKDCITGKGVKVAVIDSGIDYNHADFNSCDSGGTQSLNNLDDFVSNQENISVGEGYIFELDSESVIEGNSLQSVKLEQNNLISKIESLGIDLSGIKTVRYEKVLNAIYLNVSQETSEKIEMLEEVKKISPNFIYKINNYDSVPFIRGDQVWGKKDGFNNNITGEGVRVAILDTGVDYYHSDLDCPEAEPLSGDGVPTQQYEGYIVELEEISEGVGVRGGGSFKQRILEFKNRAASKLGYRAESGLGILAFYKKRLPVEREFSRSFTGVSLKISDEEAESLEFVEGVKKVYKNKIFKPTLYDSVSLIHADGVWDYSGGVTGAGIEIAIIDTGVDYTHPDLGGCLGSECKVKGGYDFIGGDSNPKDSSHYHGTHVAGIAAGNGLLKGVAPDADIYAYRVCDSNGCTEDDIIAAIERATDPNQDGDTSDHHDIISMSLGADCGGNYGISCGPDDLISLTVDYATSVGVVSVISAGNSGPGMETIGSPGTARSAITVGSSDKYDDLSVYSSRGPVEFLNSVGEQEILIKPDVLAPGEDICSAKSSYLGELSESYKCLNNNYLKISGTSMAAPHVSGLVALILEENPGLSPAQVKENIMNNAGDFGFLEYEQGKGKVDSIRSVYSYEAPVSRLNKIKNAEELGELIEVNGTVYSDKIVEHVLEYRLLGDDPFVFYTNGITQVNQHSNVENSILAYIDTSIIGEGTYVVRMKKSQSRRSSGESEYRDLEKSEMNISAERKRNAA